MSEVRRGYKQTEVGMIPEDWETKPCSAVSALITVGIVIRPTQYYVKQGIPALRSANVREDGVDENDMVFISERANALLSKSQVRTDDVLTVRTGYPGTSVVVPPHLSGANCIDILITRPSKAINSYYLAAWINSPHGKYQVLRDQGGLAQQHFNVGDLRDLVIALPPNIGEQEAIAEALSDADALIESLEQLLTKKRQTKQGAMQELLTGKKRLPGFSDSWMACRIEDVADVKTGPFGSSLHERDYVQDGTPIITVEHLGEFGVVHSNLPMVSDIDRRRLEAYSMQEHDIVFSRVGSIDRNALIRSSEAGWLFSGRLLRLRLNTNRAFPPFLSYQFHAESFKRRVKTVAVGQTMACLSTQILNDVEVRLPSLPEQTAIAAVLSDMDADISALETKLSKARHLKQGMMQELLTGKIRLV